MEVLLNEEQLMLKKTCANFANSAIRPKAAHYDLHHEFPKNNVQKMAELGLLGIAVSTEYEGAGMDTVSYFVALEEISRGCASHGVIMSVNNSLACYPIEAFGTHEQKKRWLCDLATGRKLGCFCLTEPGAGSDVASMRTTAKISSDGKYYTINGTKNFITNGGEANTAVVFANISPESGHKGITAFIVDAQTPGYKVTKLEKKMGIKASSTAQILFEEMKIPAENMLGKAGEGMKIALSTLDGGRIGIAAQALGIAQDALDRAVSYAKVREQFGAPIAKLQAIQWMIAEMETELVAARMLVYLAAIEKDKGLKTYGLTSAKAKLKASETCRFVTDRAIQVHGGYGYIEDYEVERLYRDAKITELYEGTSEIQKLVISRALLK